MTIGPARQDRRGRQLALFLQRPHLVQRRGRALGVDLRLAFFVRVIVLVLVVERDVDVAQWPRHARPRKPEAEQRRAAHLVGVRVFVRPGHGSAVVLLGFADDSVCGGKTHRQALQAPSSIDGIPAGV